MKLGLGIYKNNIENFVQMNSGIGIINLRYQFDRANGIFIIFKN